MSHQQSLVLLSFLGGPVLPQLWVPEARIIGVMRFKDKRINSLILDAFGKQKRTWEIGCIVGHVCSQTRAEVQTDLSPLAWIHSVR